MSKASKMAASWYAAQAGAWVGRFMLAAQMGGVALSEAQCQEIADILSHLLFRPDGRKDVR